MTLTIHYFDDQWQPNPAGLNWRAVGTAEVGGDSEVVAAAWVRWRAAWGGSTFKIVAWDETRPLGEPDYRRDWWLLPANTRSFTAEGRRQGAATVIDVDLLQLAK